MLFEVLKKHDLIDTFNLNEKKLHGFLNLVEMGYFRNPYVNAKKKNDHHFTVITTLFTLVMLFKFATGSSTIIPFFCNH